MPRKTTCNAQGGGTIRQRKDGRWEARYTNRMRKESADKMELFIKGLKNL